MVLSVISIPISGLMGGPLRITGEGTSERLEGPGDPAWSGLLGKVPENRDAMQDNARLLRTPSV